MAWHEVKVGQHVIRLDARSDSIALDTVRYGFYEPVTLLKWQDICSGGGTIIDVGCYTGLFSIVAALNGCRVIAFEPMPKNYERALQNFETNGVTGKVDLRHECVTDKVGPAVIKWNPNVGHLTGGASLLYPSGGQQSQNMPIHGVTIDSLKLRQCTAIKIDVERGEPHVLRGAVKTLKKYKQALIVEVLGETEQARVREAITDYRVAQTMDTRNWLMLPD